MAPKIGRRVVGVGVGEDVDGVGVGVGEEGDVTFVGVAHGADNASEKRPATRRGGARDAE